MISKTGLVTAGAGIAAFVGTATKLDAVPVTYEATGQVTNGFQVGNGNYAPGDATVGDIATVRITYDINPADVVSFSEGAYQYTLGAITSLVLSVNGESYEFVNDNNNGNHLVQIDDTSNNVGDLDQFYTSINTHDPNYQTSETADLLFEYAASQFDPGFNLGIPTGDLVTGDATFVFYGDGTEYSGINVDFDSVRLAESGDSIAVPTPAAFGASVLLMPLLLRRKRDLE